MGNSEKDEKENSKKTPKGRNGRIKTGNRKGENKEQMRNNQENGKNKQEIRKTQKKR